MNLNVFDIPKNPPKACDSYDNPQVQDKIESLFDTGLVKSTADIYSTNNSQNRFYTMPNTQPANEQTRLAEWCYKLPLLVKKEMVSNVLQMFTAQLDLDIQVQIEANKII